MNEATNGASPLAEKVRHRRLSGPLVPEVAECRRIREVAGVSLREMAEELGVSVTAVWHWENGQDGPSVENASRYRALLEQLAKAAGTEIAEAS